MKPYFVEKSFHEGWMCNKWCVWDPDRVFVCACEDRKDAQMIADALKEKQLKLF